MKAYPDRQAESRIANGVRTICAPSGEFLSARGDNQQCGQECPHSVRAESPVTNGGRASPRAARAESPATNGGRASPRAARAESPVPNGGRASPRAARAESPASISGRSPTFRRKRIFKPCKGVIKWMSPLQGLMIFGTSYVGLRPTLLPAALSGLRRAMLLPAALSGLRRAMLLLAALSGLRPTLVPTASSGL